MTTAFKKVFSRFRYLLLALIVSLTIFVLATWLPNLPLVWQVVTSSTISFFEKASFLTNLVSSIQTNFSTVTATYTILIAGFFGINVAMTTYYFRQEKTITGKGLGTGIGGFISGIFGIGCATCGSFIITPLLALIGAGGFLTLLPFGGEEFGFLGVGLLGFSVMSVAKKINQPSTCPIEKK